MTPTSAISNFALALRFSTIAGAVLWWLSIKAYSTRTTYLLHYASQAVVPPRWEVFVPTPLPTLIVMSCGALFWIVFNELLWRRLRDGGDEEAALVKHQWVSGTLCLIAASLPWLVDLAIHWQTAEPLLRATGVWGPSVWQPLWLAGFSGLAADRFVRALQASQPAARQGSRPPRRSDTASSTTHASPTVYARLLAGSVVLMTALCAAWWYMQSQQAFAGLMLGFNDCGHFAQRIANTAAGRGWLIESPVLPRFWDHFNPGLTLLVPLWIAWPKMSLFFVLQVLSLAGCAPLIMLLARSLGASPLAACLWALAWLAQPVLGQMNLAYSYGWHPISLAIPLLLLALLCVVKRRWWCAIAFVVLASSMEEGVLIVVATTAATLGGLELLAWLTTRSGASPRSNPVVRRLASSCQAARGISSLLPARAWIAVAALATIAFVLIFRLSGLAEFQTGRFHKLGGSTLEILLSPVWRPDVFWGLLLRSRNAIFLIGILLPCCLPAMLRAWPLLLPTVLPIGVLLVWDHLPAQSLAFHYPSVLLPVIWLAALVGALSRNGKIDSPTHEATADASPAHRHFSATAVSLGAAALATSMVASINFGQFPWSGKTLGDVDEVTYSFDSELLRRGGDADNDFAHAQLQAIAERGEQVLATGRLATHLVGCSELETVGQFAERRRALAKLTSDQNPLRRYRWLILDRHENFQQTRSQTMALQQEALANGFRIVADRFDIVVLERQ